MQSKLTLDEFNLLQELQSSGIPINFRPLKTQSRTSSAITLRQTGNPSENAVYLPFGYNECCCVMTIAISNQSNRNVRLEACRLKIPSGVADFRWLEKPRGNVPREFIYRHDAHGRVGFEPELVLNHRFASGFKVFPGETVEGMLIGAGDPELHHYPNRKEVEVELVLFDARGHDYHLPMALKVFQRQKPTYSQPVRTVKQPPRGWIKEAFAKAELEDKRQAQTVKV